MKKIIGGILLGMGTIASIYILYAGGWWMYYGTNPSGGSPIANLFYMGIMLIPTLAFIFGGYLLLRKTRVKEV